MYGKIIIGVIFIIVFMTITWVYTKKRIFPEGFLNVNFVQDKTILNVHVPKDDYDARLFQLGKHMRGKLNISTTKEQKSTPGIADVYYDDILGYETASLPEKRIVAVSDDTKMACFIKDANVMDSNEVGNLANSTIGYINEKDVDVIKSIMYCCDVPLDNMAFAQMKSYDDAIIQLFEKKSIKSLFVLINIQNQTILEKFTRHKLLLYSYDQMEVNKLRVLLPFAVVRNYDFKKSFKTYFTRFGVRKTLAFNNIFYSTTTQYNYMHDLLIKSFAHNYEYVNLFRRYFDIHPRTLELLHKNDNDKMKRMQKTILEQFENNKEKVFFDATSETARLATKIVNGVPLHVGDVLKFQNQVRKVHKQNYRVHDVSGWQTVLKKVKHIGTPPKNDMQDPRYICYTDKNIKIKGLCESSFDEAGIQKRSGKPDVWDRPCDGDEECPFYQKNKNYKNYRGGCNDGYCEMPIGVKQISFRKYEGTPLCHGCENKFDKECCDKQKKPDYAFPLDEYERGVKIREQFEPNTHLIGEFMGDTNENVYHFEHPNDVIQQKLVKVQDTLINFKKGDTLESMITRQVLEATNNKKTNNPMYNVYDFEVTQKDVAESESKIAYELLLTLYQQEKSHGKRVNVKCTQDMKTGHVYIIKVAIIGIMPQSEIGTKQQPIGQTLELYNKNIQYYNTLDSASPTH